MSDRMARVVVGLLGFRATGLLRWSAVTLLMASLAWVGVDRWKAWELAREGQALETRAFELVTRAMAPGSALACLDAMANSAFQEGCEKALFATPESTAAAVSYVAAQLSLLEAGRNYTHRSDVDYGASLAQLRRNAEWDAFGLVAHVLAARDGCTVNGCPALAALKSPHRVQANLSRRTFDANVSRYAVVWASGGRSEVARAPGREPPADEAPEVVAAAPATAAPATRKPNNYFFPSADSIPAVSIMAAEPGDGPGDKPRTASPEGTRKPAARTSASVTANAAATNPTAARAPAAPMTLAPVPPASPGK
jgi:hypothetical protein